jgi:2-oxoglutarate dehydrogenase E2 component (dihydrolipoamide succinyltransferase)
MARKEIRMPKLGESVIEATITRWLKNEGDAIQAEEAIVEIATDKVDTEIVAPESGILVSRIAAEGDVIPIGGVVAMIETGGEASAAVPKQEKKPEPAPKAAEKSKPEPAVTETTPAAITHPGTRFYSPLVRSIAKQENIPLEELEKIPGSGKDDRLTKDDVLEYLKNRATTEKAEKIETPAPKSVPVSGDDRVIEMDRVRKLIADHMVRSVQTSPHVTSFAEIDMTRVVAWRDKYKDAFQKKENQKLTFTPIFIEAIAKAVRDVPMMNVSVDGNKVIVHPNIHVGMAVALPSSNLIVPVIKNADQKSLLGITLNVNDLADKARNNKLQPDDIAGGTISLTNLGSFGTLMGTPIINQPQTAIVAVGSIKKRPVVLETPEGDTIAIRQMMMASVTYDHRVIDGALAGQFLNRLVFHLEHFNTDLTI